MVKQSGLKPLTVKEERFCYEYIKDENGTRSALDAGYCRESGNKRSAAQQATFLLKKPYIIAKIAEIREKQTNKAIIEVQDIIKRLRQVALERPEANNADIIRACELLGKHLGMFVDRQEVVHTIEHRPSDPQARIQWHKRELALLEAQEQAGTAIATKVVQSVVLHSNAGDKQ